MSQVSVSKHSRVAKRILFLVSDLTGGGAERVAVNLATQWIERGYDVALVATFSGRGKCQYRLPEGVRLIFLADEARVLGRGAMAYIRRFVALRRLIRREAPVFVVSFLTNVNVATLICSMRSGVPVIVSERTYPPSFPLGRMLGALRYLLYPSADRVVLQTARSLQWLETRIPRAHGVVIPNPVAYPLPQIEPSVHPEAFLRAGRRLLLSVGRLSEEKGFGDLLDAFGMLSNRFPEWDLAVLGEGPERLILERQSERLGLQGRIVFPGYVGNLRDWYSRADLYVLSSRFEGFPNSLLEAMAHGCAVVSYDCDTGPRDMIRHDENGVLVVPAGNTRALSDALDRLMSDETLRERLGLAAEEVRVRFAASRVMATWEALIDEVTSCR